MRRHPGRPVRFFAVLLTLGGGLALFVPVAGAGRRPSPHRPIQAAIEALAECPSLPLDGNGARGAAVRAPRASPEHRPAKRLEGLRAKASLEDLTRQGDALYTAKPAAVTRSTSPPTNEPEPSGQRHPRGGTCGDLESSVDARRIRMALSR